MERRGVCLELMSPETNRLWGQGTLSYDFKKTQQTVVLMGTDSLADALFLQQDPVVSGPWLCRLGLLPEIFRFNLCTGSSSMQKDSPVSSRSVSRNNFHRPNLTSAWDTLGDLKHST